MEVTENALKVLRNRYLRSDNETPRQLLERVARAVAAAELYYSDADSSREWEKKFLELMASFRFLPNSPTLMNAGCKGGQLSACYVLPVEDTMNGIFSTLRDTALIQQSGGGTGFNFSAIRPEGDLIQATQGKATGPLSFMGVYSSATEAIKQGGKRRGTNMGILNADHPDILDFVHMKSDDGLLNNFNISVGTSDAFMKAVQADKPWELRHPSSREVVRTIPARELWDSIVQHAWKTGDPGLIFLDTINRGNPTPDIGMITATNPCGEVPLLPYESCNLGSLNLSLFVKNRSIQWQELKEAVHTAVRFLDNVIDVNHYILPEMARMARGNRKIGLGVMGWASLLIRSRLPYASAEALSLAEKLMQFIREESDKASRQLAQERGPFRNWKQSIYYPDEPIRNATRLSIAPTGTISTIAGTLPSIEPLFALAYERNHVLDDDRLSEFDPLLLAYLEEKGLNTPENLNKISRSGTLEGIDISDESRALFQTALEIPYETHIDHQVAFQQYTDNAVSKTINLPEEASEKDVEHAYQKAWEEGCKGITIFRYNSKGKQVYTKGIGEEQGQHPCTICAT